MRYKTYNYYQKSDVRGGDGHKKENGSKCREHEYIHTYKHKTKKCTEGGQCH